MHLSLGVLLEDSSLIMHLKVLKNIDTGLCGGREEARKENIGLDVHDEVKERVVSSSVFQFWRRMTATL